MADVRVVWDDAALALMVRSDPRIRAGMDRLAGRAEREMKRLCPVSPVLPVYARPIPQGSSTGRVYRGGKTQRPRLRLAGDFPLLPSGWLRRSIHSERQPEGDILIGSAVNYALYVDQGTHAHVIRSTGPWPLRNRATGQVFGPVVHHPGTTGVFFVERAAALLDGVQIRI